MFEMGAKFNDGIDIVCKKCGELKSACVCKDSTIKAKDSYNISINEQKANGKDITRCGVFFEHKKDLESLLKELKKSLATGGSIEAKDGGFYLILQGKHKDATKAFLKSKKYQFKK